MNTAADHLRAVLESYDKKTDREWIDSLSRRKLEELEFHDKIRVPHAENTKANDTYEALHSNDKFYSTVEKSRNYATCWIQKHSPGKIVLDYACGNGENARLAAKSGASLAVGLDISRVSVENCRRIAAQENLTANTCFVQGDCENTGLPDKSIDVVICSGMLHHLDLSYAFFELRRIMKVGAILLAVEALDYNPMIKLYRLFTPSLRTNWEKAHILSLKDLTFARRFFDVRHINYWHLFSILSTPFRNNFLFRPALGLGNLLDSIFLKVFPISLLAWIFTFELIRRDD
jgi:ubiquinone/menaquinone biosynthesis C-methylase UbiE